MARRNLAPAAHWSQTPLDRLITPIQEFIQSAAAGGIVLIITTVVALIIANSGLADQYNQLLQTEIAVSFGPFQIEESLLHWINDGLMAVFFFLVGLELKREALVGELADLRKATLPLFAAIGGVTVPALLYLLVNSNGAGRAGWGIPMATDIAFALGVLALLGSRIPWTLKVFLTAVAVIDDLIAVLVIALFYSSGLNMAALGIGFGVLLVLAALNYLGVRNIVVYIALGLIVWVAFLESGVHATIAGVLVALTIPARNRIDGDAFLARAQAILNHFGRHSNDSPRMITDEHQQSALIELEDACEAVQAPLQKLEHRLHGWVAFGIVPLFALANAGVRISLDTLTGPAVPVVSGIMLGLIVGKPLGLITVSWLVVRSGLAALPQGVTWSHMVGVGCLAGLGFTMSIFIGTLGFDDTALVDAGKIGILAASLIAGVLGYTLLRRLPAANDPLEAPHAG